MNRTCNALENEFVDFMAERTERSRDEVEDIFLRTRERFRFDSDAYNGLTGHVAHLYRILYDTDTDARAVQCYQAHALLHLYRYISYTYPKAKSRYVRELIRDLRRGDLSNLRRFLQRRWGRSPAGGRNVSTAERLLEAAGSEPVVLDYGCGLAHVSLEMARRAPGCRVYLVDVDCLTLDFAAYRFRRAGRDVRVIRVTPDNVYPEIPSCDVCILHEVLEHVFEPLRVCESITRSLRSGGVLYGRFDDHGANMYHVSTDLAAVRAFLETHFEHLGHDRFGKRPAS